MTDSGKRKLSAKQIASDIRAGMDASALKRKYGLSDKSLDKVYLKLKDAGFLKEHEKPRLASTPAPTPSRLGAPQDAGWKCPACGWAQASAVPECPMCGIVVAKYVGREGPRKGISTVSPVSGRDAGSSDGRNWAAVVLSIVVLGLFGAYVLLRSGNTEREKTETASVKPSPDRFHRARVQTNRPHKATSDRRTTSTALPEKQIEDFPRSEPAFQPFTPAPLEPALVKASPPKGQGSPPKKEATSTPESTPYVTGVLRSFHARNFKREVVEASKTYPVVLQFYSDT